MLANITNVAIPTARFSDPPILQEAQAMPCGTEGNRPQVTKKQPPYLMCAEVERISIKNPAILCGGEVSIAELGAKSIEVGMYLRSNGETNLEGATNLGLVCEKASCRVSATGFSWMLKTKQRTSNAHNTCYEIRRCSHKLSLRICVTHTFDNGWQEQAHRVSRQCHTSRKK